MPILCNTARANPILRICCASVNTHLEINKTISCKVYQMRMRYRRNKTFKESPKQPTTTTTTKFQNVAGSVSECQLLCGGRKQSTRLHLSVVIFFLVLRDQWLQYINIENWIQLKPVLGDVRGVAFSIISYEQTQ